MLMEIVLGDGSRVEARKAGMTITTDQDGSAPAPFDLFLASIGTCAGFYLSHFCRRRNIPTDGIRIGQRMAANPETRMIERIEIELELPEEFPEKYRAAVLRAVDQCAVKKHLADPPEIVVTAGTPAARPGG